MKKKVGLIAVCIALANQQMVAMSPSSASEEEAYLPFSVENSLSPGTHSDIEQQQRDLNNRLLGAILDGRYDKVFVLIHRGADVNFRSMQMKTPLIWAANEGYADICRLLIENGADLEAVSDTCDTALMRAALAGNESVVRVLLTTLPLADQRKIIPLREAIITAQLALKKSGLVSQKEIRILITLFLIDEFVEEQMARVDRMIEMKNEYGNTAFDLALERNHPEIAQLLSPESDEWRFHALKNSIRRMLFAQQKIEEIEGVASLEDPLINGSFENGASEDEN